MDEQNGSWDDLPPQSEGSTAASEAEAGTTKLRVTGMPFNQSFTTGDVTVTREGTAVPAGQAQDIINAARRSGIQLEVVAE